MLHRVDGCKFRFNNQGGAVECRERRFRLLGLKLHAMDVSSPVTRARPNRLCASTEYLNVSSSPASMGRNATKQGTATKYDRSGPQKLSNITSDTGFEQFSHTGWMLRHVFRNCAAWGECGLMMHPHHPAPMSCDAQAALSTHATLLPYWHCHRGSPGPFPTQC